MKPPLCILTIAGSDSGAGAGIQADSRAIHALGGYALTAITAVTAQNKRGVSAWRAVSPELLAAQIEAVVGDFSITAAKTGLLAGSSAVKAVAKSLPPWIPLVIDPVIGSTSGTRFLSDAGVMALKKHLLPRATLTTPNWPEAALLTGLPVTTFCEAEAAARALLATGCQAVLVKGGHGGGRICRDFLVMADGRVRWFEHTRVSTPNTHGTGCVLSAAIATGLAHGRRIDAAVSDAVKFLQKSLKAGRMVNWDGGRAGPAFAG